MHWVTSQATKPSTVKSNSSSLVSIQWGWVWVYSILNIFFNRSIILQWLVKLFFIFLDSLLDPSFHPQPPNFSILTKSPLRLSRPKSKKACYGLGFFSLPTSIQGAADSFRTVSLHLLKTCPMFRGPSLSFWIPCFSSLYCNQNSVTLPKLHAKNR